MPAATRRWNACWCAATARRSRSISISSRWKSRRRCYGLIPCTAILPKRNNIVIPGREANFDVQLHIRESRDSGSGPSDHPGMTKKEKIDTGGLMKLVRYESAGHVATITMDRASAHNALNPALCEELCEAWRRFRDSDDRVAVLAAAEEAYFCVGADVRDFPSDMWRAGAGLGVELDKPGIAATSGWVVGGGFVLVQMADMFVASGTTRFSYPEVKVCTTGGGAV